MKKILILEDDLKTQELLKTIFESLDIHTSVYATESMKDAYVKALNDFIDLFVIDIILDKTRSTDTSGITFVEKIRQISHYKLTPVIFITGLEDPKFYAYSQLHCYSYLEKPFDFKTAARQFTEILESTKDRPEMSTNFYFRKDGILYALETEKIITIEIRHKKIVIRCVDDNLELPYIPLNIFTKDLDPRYFLQCNRSTIVNRRFIRSVDTVNNYVSLTGDYGKLDIGRVMKSEFLYRFRND